ncbi:MAG: translation factor (SUA5), partial [Clostridiales bacterium]|nr:translation factor (SUA5) [Clostridiales bacterium]
GFITGKMLSDVLGMDVELDPALKNPGGAIRPKAPGMKYRHYAPKAQMTIVDGTADAVVREIAGMTQAARAAGEKVAVIASDETAGAYAADVVLAIGRRGDGEEAARQLYRILRRCDELGVDVIFAEQSDFGTLREAVMNRMLKAAGQRIVHAGGRNTDK